LRYVLAVTIVAIGLLLKLVLDTQLGPNAPFVILSGAIVAAAWLGGLGPGLLATGLAVLIADWFFVEPRGSLTVAASQDRLRLALFMLEGVLVSLLSGAFHAAREREARTADAERRRAHELEALVEAMDEAVLVFDPAGRVSLANRAAIRLLGPAARLAFSEVIGRFGGETAALPAFGSPSPSEPVEARLDDTARWFEIRAYPIRTDAVSPSTMLLIRDVSEDRQTSIIREAFIGLLSHELRTPITTIFGGSAVLARPSLSNEVRLDLAADIASEADRLHRLVEDLLVLAKVERTALEIGNDPVQVQHVVGRVVDAATNRWPGREIRMSVEPGLPTASGDATYVEQITRNLVGNAAKYGEPGSPIDVAVDATDEAIRIQVRDRGPGIDADDAPYLFDLFFRSSTTRAVSGAGIGLFVCRQLARAMGGDVEYERMPDGSRFSLTVPRLEEEHGDDADWAPEVPAAAPS
jgi:K+-sensing histidine kinase KdpD